MRVKGSRHTMYALYKNISTQTLLLNNPVFVLYFTPEKSSHFWKSYKTSFILLVLAIQENKIN